ncbi:MAG: hypothetical protein ABI538_14480 [Pseudoxanthomonas sp.]
MINSFVRYAAGAALVVLLSSCGGKPEASVENTAPAATTAPDPNVVTGAAIDPELAAQLKELIATKGGQCVNILSAQGEDASSRIKVTCSGQAGDPDTVSYTVDPGI